jgi:hypothetical protein
MTHRDWSIRFGTGEVQAPELTNLPSMPERMQCLLRPGARSVQELASMKVESPVDNDVPVALGVHL